MTKISSPAKINLFLRVTGKRSDGYHELETLMCKVGLFDTITMDTDHKGVGISCKTPGIPEDEQNLAHRAASAFSDALFLKTGTPFNGVFITLKKRIPAGAGLGGGSSNAASVLVELNRKYDHPFTDGELRDIGLSIGADVPFFIIEGPALATGIGEKLKPFRTLSPLWAVIVHPGFSVSTQYVYKNLNLRLTKEKKKLSSFPFSNKKFDIKKHLVNDLESVTLTEYPVISEIKKTLIAQGAEGALMSGSGASVFGLFTDPDRALFVKNTLKKKHHIDWMIFSADLLI